MGSKDENKTFNTLAYSYFEGWASAVSDFWEEIGIDYHTMAEENGFE
ncbi:MAG: hypothetical protein ACE5IW_14060 [bacterium]